MTSAAARTASLQFDLPLRQPFDAPGVFHFLAVRALPGVEVAEMNDVGRLRYARTLRFPQGPGAFDAVATQAPDGGWGLNVRLELTSMADVEPAVARVRRLFDLDADPSVTDAALSADPTLAPLVEQTPGIRVPGAVDPHEMVIRAIVGQQISVAAARTHLTRMTTAAGSPYQSDIAGLDRLFPNPEQIAGAVPVPEDGETLDPERPLRLPRQSIRAVVNTARALADGELDVHADSDPELLRSELVAVPRIGVWTAAYIAMRVLRDPDAWLTGDVALVAGAKAVGILDAEGSKAAHHRLLAEHATMWAPWRSYASMHLWQAAIAASARNNGSSADSPSSPKT